MAASKPLHFRETMPVKNTLWRAADLLILSLLTALLCCRLISTRRREALWIVAFLCEAWFTFVWLLHINSKWNPVRQITYPERLSKREFQVEDLPAVDMFLTTANPELEPPMITVNTVLSLLAVDYPPHKLACYVSDDGFSAATYRAMVEASEFARSWVPFCKKYAVQVRAPLHYFFGEPEPSPSISPDFLHDWEAMKRMYRELERRVEEAHLRGDTEPIFSQFDRENHPSVIKAIWENKGDPADGVPHLFYVAREKNPNHHHHFKGGAMNVLTRVSGVITNAPFMVNVDCDMFVNNPAVILHAMCLLLGFDMDKMSGFFLGRGMEGLQGPFYYGTGCFHRRNAIYGEAPDDPPFGRSRRLQSSAADIISGLRKTSLAIDDLAASMHAAVDVSSCSYELHSLWGDEVGWAYGSATEDIQTGLRIHAKGWRSVTLNPQPPIKRWATGVLENLVGQHSPLLAAVNGKLGRRQCLAYLLLNLWAARSLPELCYALLTPFSVVANTSFLPAGLAGVVPAAIFAIYNVYTVAEYLAVGESLRSWWNNQRMRRITAATAYLFGLLSVVAKLVGLSEAAFEITKKEVNAPAAAVNTGGFTFDASPLFVPATAVALLNSAALAAGTWRMLWAAPDGGGPGLGELACATWAVLSYSPFIVGLFRRAQYGLPRPTVVKASVLSFLFVLLSKLASS
ncbi:unnamed protein product [Spirodela intermedia]|uniref:Uncharacterized protein n=1 Tax=Spirodela intermedia TaxID=51605 RepID=A0A7I8JDZ4_SPIIN|nr:unnamed protein product [Spirodela intermedia]CAA6668374.1 unnamed protein product [Spirodela intermedia]